jgi:hypothetical protein
MGNALEKKWESIISDLNEAYEMKLLKVTNNILAYEICVPVSEDKQIVLGEKLYFTIIFYENDVTIRFLVFTEVTEGSPNLILKTMACTQRSGGFIFDSVANRLFFETHILSSDLKAPTTFEEILTYFARFELDTTIIMTQVLLRRFDE